MEKIYMLKSALFKAFLTISALFLIPIHANGTRKVVTLKVTPNSTVADLIRTTKSNYTGLNLPTSPEFASRKPWQTLPFNMKTYPALYKIPAGTLTTASMIRFIKQSHTLFEEDQSLKRGYQLVLKECIAAHKTWYSNQNQENIVVLRTASEKVMELLNTLNLSNPITRLLLQRMLSTPKQGMLSNAWDALICTKRSTIQGTFGKTESKMKLIVQPNESWAITSLAQQALKMTCVMLVLEKAFGNEKSLSPITIIAIGSMLYSMSSRWMNDYNLTTEPGSGIKVHIEFDEGKNCDHSGNYNF